MADKLTRERIWDYIRKLGRPVRNEDLQKEFRLSMYAARAHLTKLRQMGGLKRTGKTYGSSYVVIKPKLDVSDRRGTNPNSLRALRHVMGSNVRRVPADKPRKDWPKATELEKLWTFDSKSLDRTDGE